MAHRPRRTFRQRRVDSSDSDVEQSADLGAPGEQAAPDASEERPPSREGRAEVADRPHRGRGSRGRGRGRVWASSRRNLGAAPRGDVGPGQPVNIPDEAFIQAARRKREMARAQDDYIALDGKHTSAVSGIERNSDEDAKSEPDDHEERIPFTPKPQTLKQRMFEETSDILQDHKKIFEDVHDDFCNIQNILLKFQQWREKFPDSYYEAFIGLCIPKLLNPLIRVQLIGWNPLKLFRNILHWNGLLPDDALHELGLGKLLNRYLIIALLNDIPGPDVVKKCNQQKKKEKGIIK
ncbi:GC-rich sequence DNA-binding factor [Tupaia chinensis]|uniref:GC-rich sequence DNA-binding factor n=1 Tax=Tupaia chinensis TaxID=246437 RepID=L9KNG9_TUPCH|nr:GC-rich sequence DNA-binding factor [Tupaia chinensis]